LFFTSSASCFASAGAFTPSLSELRRWTEILAIARIEQAEAPVRDYRQPGLGLRLVAANGERVA
jgi:hypothetical protein